MHVSLTKKTLNIKSTQIKLLLRNPGVEMEWDYSGIMGRDEKQEDR